MGVLCVDCLNEARSQARPIRSRLGFTMTAGPPVIAYVLISLNVLAYAYGNLVEGFNEWMTQWALVPGLTDQLFGVGTEPYRWVTSGFAHWDLLHIGMNMFALWQLGNALESALGRWRFAGIYGASLLGSSLAVVLLSPTGSFTAGASGAIFGLLAAYGIVLRRLRLPYQSVLVIAAIFIGAPLASALIPGFSFLSGLSWQGHLGGAIVGAITMLVMFRGVDRREAAARASRS